MKVVVRKRSQCPKGKCRVMLLDREAVYELLREHMVEYGKSYFDLRSDGSTEFSMRWNYETGAFVCVAYRREERPPIDFDRIERSVQPTTDTVYTAEKRYKELPLSAVMVVPVS